MTYFDFLLMIGNNEPLYLTQVGKSTGMFYGYVYDGVYQYDDFNVSASGVYVLKNDVPSNGNTRGSIQPGDLLPFHSWDRQETGLPKLLPELFGQISHFVIVLHPLVEPLKNLPGSESGLSQSGEKRLQFPAAHGFQISHVLLLSFAI